MMMAMLMVDAVNISGEGEVPADVAPVTIEAACCGRRADPSLMMGVGNLSLFAQNC